MLRIPYADVSGSLRDVLAVAGSLGVMKSIERCRRVTERQSLLVVMDMGFHDTEWPPVRDLIHH